MTKRLVLDDGQGTVMRSFSWQGEPVSVIRRSDTQRLELVSDTAGLIEKKVAFQELGAISSIESLSTPLKIGQLGSLRFVESIQNTNQDAENPRDRQRVFYRLLALFALLCIGFLAILRSVPQTTAKLEEELKLQVVKIVKNIKVEAAKITPTTTMAKDAEVRPKETQKRTDSIKRMGALSVLGSLKASHQRGGLNLQAAHTTAGPGLGGTQGSGGVQTSLYAKGLVGAPLGPGANIQGAGGYGTKGAGGGQAGYGKLALTGSMGSNPIPLGAEASVAKGLDRDQIAAVINRNLGQVRFCYEQGLQSDSSLNGRVAVNFTIGGNGLVKLAGVESSSLKAQVVEECILMRLKSWKFPLPDGGVDVQVTYPFMLRRSGQG